MNEKKRTPKQNKLKLTADDLKGKQSVRATFRLPEQVIDLLSVIAKQLGIKQKSLFDQLIEDTFILEQIAKETRSPSLRDENLRQKTFVISRSSLASLNLIAKQQQIPRDILVEISIKRLLPIIESELEKHEKRKILLKEMKDYLEQGKKLLAEAGNLLGEEDSVYEMIQQQVNLCRRNVSLVNDIVENGVPMENW